MAKIREGDDIGAAFLNNHEDVYEWWRRRKKFGEGGAERASAVNFSKVSAANYTGEQIYIGDVCEFTKHESPFPDIDPAEKLPDPRCDRWVKAVTPDTTRIGWGIALEPIGPATGGDREGGDFLVLGSIHARVIIEDEDHQYAERRDGERVLHSTAARTSCKILIKPALVDALPEERCCLVQIMDEGGDSVDIVQVYDTGNAGDVIVPDMDTRPAFLGKIRRYYSPGVNLTEDGYCWILFVDDYGNVQWDTAAVNHECYGPAKYVGVENFDGTEHPLYLVRRGELCEMVQVYHEGDTPPSNGDVVEAIDGGVGGGGIDYHPGYVTRRDAGGGISGFGKCWIVFTTPLNGLAIQGQLYGPAKYSGTWDRVQNAGEEDETHDKRPVFVMDHGEHAFPGRFGSDLTFHVYHPLSLTDSGFTLSYTYHGDPVIEGKGFVQYVAGRWFGTNSECETSPE